MRSLKSKPDLNTLYEGIVNGDRVLLGKGITLIESSLGEDIELASTLLEKILPHSGKSLRIGITGIPGVGKSTFIESFGQHIVDGGTRLAVLSIDPTSSVTRGSILGDKTRMEKLSKDQRAFIRPSATALTLGGVAAHTRECMLLCEAAGYEVVIVETVGVGQSETAVRSMVDFFLLLMIAGAGDELQGIKKGIIELADGIVITKADGDNVDAAIRAKNVLVDALHFINGHATSWKPPVLTSSAYHGTGIADVWSMVQRFDEQSRSHGHFQTSRMLQNVSWFNEFFSDLLYSNLHIEDSLKELKRELESSVAEAKLPARAAAKKLMKAYHDMIRRSDDQ
ncbi:MAG: methylmalonyl Co-A mutase-associated GTPase MeaB [Chryseolinea sp.]